MPTLDFGVEIECLLPSLNAGAAMTQERLAAVITNAGVPCRAAGYNHHLSRTWKIVSDGSLRPGANQLGFEVVSPPLDENGLDQVTKVCEALAALGATVNRSCGLHVHVGARYLPVPVLKKLAELYINHETVVDSFMPASRRLSNCPYAKSMTATSATALAAATDLNQIARAIGHGRFAKVNFQAYWRHGTVEFRHHSGTISADKIIKWIVLCNALVAIAKKEADTPVVGTAADPREHVYWRRGGRRRRALFRMLVRDIGVTRPELAAELNLRSLPLIARHLEASGASTQTHGRRGGHDVYRLVAVSATAAPVVTSATPVTLDGLCARLELSAEDKAYWEARAASFTPSGQDREALAAARRTVQDAGGTITGRLPSNQLNDLAALVEEYTPTDGMPS